MQLDGQVDAIPHVLEGDIASNIDKTYELVQAGLKAFVDNYPRPGAETAPSAPEADTGLAVE